MRLSGRVRPSVIRSTLAAGVALLLVSAATYRSSGDAPVPQEAPRTWDEEALRDFELPPPDPSIHPEYVSAEYYYALPERVIHETYPVYHPDREPEGYLDSLRALGPRTALDMDTIDTEEEWLRAGELVFDSPQLFFPLAVSAPFDAAGMASIGTAMAEDGTYPYFGYVVQQNGSLAVGAASCGNCHIRVLPDGSVVKGAQGNFPFDRLMARLPDILSERGVPAPFFRALASEQFGAPWIDHPSQAQLSQITPEQIAELHAAVPDGVLTRQGTHYLYPARIPDLRGIRSRRYLDATGLVQHRTIGDLMRYAAFNQFMDHLNRYGDFVPSLGRREGPLPPPDSVRSVFNGRFTRFSDAQAYALARYLYSLEPLPSPHEYDDATMALGEQVFIEEGCVTCHEPPDYTNNQLTPALGFVPPDEHYDRYDIFDVSVETDPGLALYTRRGTGYYKVPSLRGLWYRSPLLHDGSLTTLDELMDPARLEDDFVPTGFKGAGVESRAVPGHPFGLELDDESRRALIAYLMTL